MSKKNSNDITLFFKPLPKLDLSPSSKLETNSTKLPKLYKETNCLNKLHNVSDLDTEFNFNDIGFYINRTLTENEITTIMTKIWIPEIDYKFLLKMYTVQNKPKYLKFQYSWLLKFPWLAYSAKEDGAFCKLCVGFTKSDGHNPQGLGTLVKRKVW